ncbi:MAG: FAD-binding protein [Rhodospirillales bacterium]
MLLAASRKGVPIRTDTPVLDLIEENGRIVGILGQHGNRQIRIAARDGGPDQRRRLLPQRGNAPEIRSAASFHGHYECQSRRYREMILQAEKHGAALDLMDQAWWVPGSKPPHGEIYMHVTDIAKPHVIMVNAKGSDLPTRQAPTWKTASACTHRASDLGHHG